MQIGVGVANATGAVCEKVGLPKRNRSGAEMKTRRARMKVPEGLNPGPKALLVLPGEEY